VGHRSVKPATSYGQTRGAVRLSGVRTGHARRPDGIQVSPVRASSEGSEGRLKEVLDPGSGRSGGSNRWPGGRSRASAGAGRRYPAKVTGDGRVVRGRRMGS
jgi:hypothetical protein